MAHLESKIQRRAAAASVRCGAAPPCLAFIQDSRASYFAANVMTRENIPTFVEASVEYPTIHLPVHGPPAHATRAFSPSIIESLRAFTPTAHHSIGFRACSVGFTPASKTSCRQYWKALVKECVSERISGKKWEMWQVWCEESCESQSEQKNCSGSALDNHQDAEEQTAQAANLCPTMRLQVVCTLQVWEC